jgi:hypothetical protein
MVELVKNYLMSVDLQRFRRILCDGMVKILVSGWARITEICIKHYY